jgi:transposase InsO family protein
LQGLASLPGTFTQLINETLNCDFRDNMRPDPLPGVASFIDDCVSVSPRSSLDLSKYTELIKEVEEYVHPLDREDAQYAQLDDQGMRDALSHLLLVDSVMSRMHHHGFKLSPKKLDLFQSRAKILGHVLDQKGLTIDPDRIAKMKNAPMPENRTQLQRYAGYLSSIKYFSPPELAQMHAILSPLASATVPYVVTDKHRQAFERSKEILTESPFYLSYPSYGNPKVLFTDASDILISGVLLDLALPPLKVSLPDDLAPDHLNISHMSHSFPIYNSKLAPLNLLVLNSSLKPKSSFFESIGVLVQLAGLDNIPVQHKHLRSALLGRIENSSLKQEFRYLLRKKGVKWSEFLEKYSAANSGLDPDFFLTLAAARFIGRDIFLVSEQSLTEKEMQFGNLRISKFSGSENSEKKPPFWLWVCPENNETTFRPLFQYQSNHLSPLTSLHQVEYDLPYIAKDKLSEMIKEFINSKGKKGEPLTTNVIGYFSQSIPSGDRDKAIWLKEAQALVSSLHKFKELVELAPIVVSYLDSSVVYLISKRAITDTCLKIKRTAVMLQLEYPNLVVVGIPGEKNISDYLSRIMSLPSVVKKTVQAKSIEIEDCTADLGFRAMTLPEAEKFVAAMPTKHSVITAKTKDQSSIQKEGCVALAVDDLEQSQLKNSRLSREEKNLLDTLEPLRFLSERLSLNNLRKAQQNLPIFETLKLKPGQEGEQKIYYDPNLEVLKMEKRLYVPPELEGTLLSYFHLLHGHIGQNKLVIAVSQNYFIPELTEKVKALVTACHACVLNNPNRKVKYKSGSVPIAAYPFETISMDFLEVAKNRHQIKAVLVVTDHFSKMILTYLMKSTAAIAVIARLQEFLAFTGACTRYILTDNGAPFSGADFNKFLYILGIYKIQSTPYLSRARGQVEVCNRILTTMLRKIMSVHPNFSFKDLVFLSSCMYNSGVHSSTKLSPYEIVFGRHPFGLSPINKQVRSPPRLFSDTVRAELQDLRKAVAERIDQVTRLLQDAQNAYLEKMNSKRRPVPKYKQGDIVFIKNYGSTSDTGERSKFRPRIYKSPFVVVAQKPRSIVVMRLADGLVTARHPQDIRVYDDSTKTSDLFKALDPKIIDILGGPLDRQNLERLARADELPIIYTDRILETSGPSTTRSLAKKKAELDNAYFADLFDPDFEDVDEEEEILPSNQSSPKRVRFLLPEADSASG